MNREQAQKEIGQELLKRLESKKMNFKGFKNINGVYTGMIEFSTLLSFYSKNLDDTTLEMTILIPEAQLRDGYSLNQIDCSDYLLEAEYKYI